MWKSPFEQNIACDSVIEKEATNKSTIEDQDGQSQECQTHAWLKLWLGGYTFVLFHYRNLVLF